MAHSYNAELMGRGGRALHTGQQDEEVLPAGCFKKQLSDQVRKPALVGVIALSSIPSFSYLFRKTVYGHPLSRSTILREVPLPQTPKGLYGIGTCMM